MCPIINTVKAANRVFSAGGCDVEAFVPGGCLYSEFSCSTKKVELLKDFCEFTNTKYKVIDVYSVMNRLRSQLITRHTDKFIEEQKNHRYLQQRETPKGNTKYRWKTCK